MARIFIAIRFNDEFKEKLVEIQDSLKSRGIEDISLVQHPSAIITDIEIPEATEIVERIYVMKSERIDSQLIYSEI